MNATTWDGPAGMGMPVSRPVWVKSPAFDLLLLMFAPLLTLPIMIGVYLRIPLLAIGGGLTLAFAHYASSATFYLWEENRAYHRGRWLAFFGGPALIAVTYLALLGLRVPYVIQFVLFFWNTFHVARQNCGLLSVYRHRAGETDPAAKVPANRAILWASMSLALWNIETHPEVAGLFALVAPGTATVVKAVVGIGALVSLVLLGRSLAGRISAGHPPSLPELLFLATSVGFFYPYLFIKTSELATFAMLLPHYVQYMGLVWLLHRRKFGQGAGVPRLLGLMSTRLRYLLPVLVLVGGAFYVMHVAALRAGQYYYFESLYLLVALEHFYVDGLTWSFRQPHVRRTIAPHLLQLPAA
jgi:hypothetical protein